MILGYIFAFIRVVNKKNKASPDLASSQFPSIFIVCSGEKLSLLNQFFAASVNFPVLSILGIQLFPIIY